MELKNADFMREVRIRRMKKLIFRCRIGRRYAFQGGEH